MICHHPYTPTPTHTHPHPRIHTAVQSIKKQQLVEIRALQHPPKMVKMALESICMLLGEPSKDWKAIRQIIIRDNFIASIINFNTEMIT